MQRVLIIDDEPQIRRFLRTSLDVHGYKAAEASDGNDGLRQITTGNFDVIILDLGLPDQDGTEVIRRVREWSRVPILVLTVRDQEGDKVRALDLGADDYVTKPFGMAELLARLRAVARRQALQEGSEPIYDHDGLRIDLMHRLVTLEGRDIRLTPKQYELLRMLARNAGKVVTHHQLLTTIWGPAHGEDVQYLRVFMRKLRSQLEEDPARPKHLLTELGVGYRLRAPGG